MTSAQPAVVEGNPLRNCFGWYFLGQVDPDSENVTELRSVHVGTVSAVDDIRKLVQQDLLGVRPTKLCTCNKNAIGESKFLKALSASTTIVDGNVQ